MQGLPSSFSGRGNQTFLSLLKEGLRVIRVSNTAMHLSRHRMAIFFDENTLQPGDGER